MQTAAPVLDRISLEEEEAILTMLRDWDMDNTCMDNNTCMRVLVIHKLQYRLT